MGKILLDYLFPITTIAPAPAASTAFLKQVCLVVKPKSGQEANVDTIYECTSMSQVADRTNNDDAEECFAAGMSKVFVLLATDLGLAAALDARAGEFFTLLISSDFDEDDFDSVEADLDKTTMYFSAKTPGPDGNDISVIIDNDGSGAGSVTVDGKQITVHIESGTTTRTQVKAAIDGNEAAAALIACDVLATGEAFTFAEAFLTGGTGTKFGSFPGVIGVWSSDKDFLAEQSVIASRVAFYGSNTNKAKNMFFAFGKLLANLVNWTNQQYVSMPYNDAVTELGDANSMFDDRISFVINDDEFGNRLALFAVGGQAIVAPYIEKNLKVDLQSRAMQWIAANQPSYSTTNATLLETRLQEDVLNQKYIGEPLKWIDAGVIEVRLLQDNFVGSGFIDIAEPKALWRLFGELRQTL